MVKTMNINVSILIHLYTLGLSGHDVFLKVWEAKYCGSTYILSILKVSWLYLKLLIFLKIAYYIYIMSVYLSICLSSINQPMYLPTIIHLSVIYHLSKKQLYV